MRKMIKTVETVKLKMLEDWVVYSELRLAGDTVAVQQPLAGLLVKRGLAEKPTEAKSKGEKSS